MHPVFATSSPLRLSLRSRPALDTAAGWGPETEYGAALDTPDRHLDKLPWRFDRDVPFFRSAIKLTAKPATPTSIPVLSVARIWVISNAKSSVYTSGQMLGRSLQRSAKPYHDLAVFLNGSMPKDRKWDWYLWPYGLLLAFAEILIRFQGTPGLDLVGKSI
jgi:hypothetical protein